MTEIITSNLKGALKDTKQIQGGCIWGQVRGMEQCFSQSPDTFQTSSMHTSNVSKFSRVNDNAEVSKNFQKWKGGYSTALYIGKK